jgi:hypothetical protein
MIQLEIDHYYYTANGSFAHVVALFVQTTRAVYIGTAYQNGNGMAIQWEADGKAIKYVSLNDTHDIEYEVNDFDMVSIFDGDENTAKFLLKIYQTDG